MVLNVMAAEIWCGKFFLVVMPPLEISEEHNSQIR